MATWIEDIVQAFTNLGGQATMREVAKEVKQIRQDPLPKSWNQIVWTNIETRSSDTKYFLGKQDLFQKLPDDIWALRDQANVIHEPIKRVSSKRSSLSSFSSTETLEEITNVLTTIKQFRAYENPASASWTEYVREIFHIMGFSTKEVGSRLLELNLIGTDHTPKAIVALVKPGENFEEMISGITWESYLTFAANYYHIGWGILTNGLQLKIIDFEGHLPKHTLYWDDMDSIIQNEKMDTFCTIHKVFSFLKGNASIAKRGVRSGKKKDKPGYEKRQVKRKFQHSQFWDQLLRKANSKTQLHSNVSSGKDYWLGTGAGKTGLSYVYVMLKDRARIELYIDRTDKGWNKKVYSHLVDHKEQIEKVFGEPLDWMLLPDKRACRIRYEIPGFGLNDEDHWEDLQDRLVEAMIRFEKALGPFIKQID